ncbi:hypothetical protein HGRIS_001589 [Hohenbuehelia grisea]|uniref:Uncharacterized protein n=1 Tax=Hohenbuehelia grisea TaxID=104357 RepID=A0ABR3JR35_9AGAR
MRKQGPMPTKNAPRQLLYHPLLFQPSNIISSRHSLVHSVPVSFNHDHFIYPSTTRHRHSLWPSRFASIWSKVHPALNLLLCAVSGYVQQLGSFRVNSAYISSTRHLQRELGLAVERAPADIHSQLCS